MQTQAEFETAYRDAALRRMIAATAASMREREADFLMSAKYSADRQDARDEERARGASGQMAYSASLLEGLLSA